MHDHHHDHHGHDHQDHHGGLGHVHAPASFGRAFAIGTALNLAFVVAELGFGVAANSLALVSDAVHNISDVIGLLLAWGGAWLAGWPATARHNFGFGRASILAALANAILLFGAVAAIAVEAVLRLLHPEPVAGPTVLWVAALGIAVNGITALLFMRGRSGDLNVRGAFLHMVADALVSAAVVVAAGVIMLTGWLWLDPVMSLVVAAVVLVGSWSLARASLAMALDAVPDNIELDAVRSYLARLNGVAAVSELRIRPVSTTETALTAHLICPSPDRNDAVLEEATHGLAHRFGIRLATIQISAGNPGDAALARTCVHTAPVDPARAAGS